MSSSERTRAEILATKRSRSSACASAVLERVRSSASAASEAIAWRSVSSSPRKALGLETEPTTRTAMTRSSATSGTKATLFAPVASTSRRLTIFEFDALWTANGDASNTVVPTPDGSLSRSIRVSACATTTGS